MSTRPRRGKDGGRGYSLEEDIGVLAGLCRRCGGRCCRGHYIVLSASDSLRLSPWRPFPVERINSPVGCSLEALDALKAGRCSFLALDGCVLPADVRPFICRMFPLTYRLENGGVVFYLSRKCPHVSEVSKLCSWLKSSIKKGYEELGRDWTRKEVRAYGGCLQGSDDGLLDLSGIISADVGHIP